ncbi:DUF4397 domain-containing protein [Pedobacter sp. SYSU D00535]|uniref:DUF4397 domain-containing protein n=1 Tax=Pedobacter sp. SYSU D00535 TaxID=2810308 RepID=UPI001A963119|nr:DUF4397 domain-containing protein [Pedobacter sp. SYSU D00535]
MKRILISQLLFIITALLFSCRESENLFEVPDQSNSTVTLYNVAKGENEGIHRVNYEEDRLSGKPTLYGKFQIGIWNESTGFIGTSSASIKPGNPINIPSAAFTNDTLRLRIFQTGVPVVNQVISKGEKDIYYYAAGGRVTHNNSRSASYALKEFPKKNEAPAPGKFKIRLLNLDYGSTFPVTAAAAQFCSLNLTDGRELIKDVPLGERSAFVELPYGTYRLAVKDNDDNIRSQVMANFLPEIAGGRAASTPVYFKPGGNYTVVCISASSYSQGYHLFDIIEDHVFEQEQFGKILLLNALPGAAGAELSSGPHKTGMLDFGNYSGYLTMPAGEHSLSVKASGATIIDEKVTLKPNDNLTLVLYEKDGKPALKAIQNVLKTGSELAGVKTQYFNFSDAPLVSFMKNNDEPITNTQWEPIANKSTYLQQGKTLTEQKKIDDWIIEYSVFDFEPWSDYFPIKLSVFTNTSQSEPLPGTRLDGVEIDYPFTYSQLGPEKADPDIYSVFLIGRSASAGRHDKARIVVIPHSNR